MGTTWLLLLVVLRLDTTNTNTTTITTAHQWDTTTNWTIYLPSLPWMDFRAMVFLLLSSLLFISVSGCPGGQWRCESGECVVLEAQCDGQSQCRDGSDEAADQCEQSACG